MRGDDVVQLRGQGQPLRLATVGQPSNGSKGNRLWMSP